MLCVCSACMSVGPMGGCACVCAVACLWPVGVRVCVYVYCSRWQYCGIIRTSPSVVVMHMCRCGLWDSITSEWLPECGIYNYSPPSSSSVSDSGCGSGSGSGSKTELSTCPIIFLFFFSSFTRPSLVCTKCQKIITQ